MGADAGCCIAVFAEVTKPFRDLRARVHRRLSTSFRQILLYTALKILAIRKYACKFLPCLQKNLLENPHIFPMNTSSYSISKRFLMSAIVAFLVIQERFLNFK